MDLIRLSACEIAALLDKGEITPDDLLDALEPRIAEVEPKIHALPTLCFERARNRAPAAAGKGPLKGLPVAVKDLAEVAGVRTTYGSPAFSDFTPGYSAYVVERIEDSGGVVYAKSNTPEFGAGAQTFNEVFPATRNPWNTALSAAGSSGGSAAALASGTAWLAHGSDMGGSLRNPASFCGVVGLRPSPGRVPAGPASDPFASLAAEGPMARDIDDTALFLDALCGVDAREPLSLPTPRVSFRESAAARRAPKKAAYSADLGLTPVDPAVREITARAAERFTEAGVIVEHKHPDFSGAHEAFQTLRAYEFAAGLKDLYRDSRDKLKPEIIWNIEQGLALSAEDITRAARLRGDLTKKVCAFMTEFDVLMTPAVIMPPFPVEQRWPESCDGQAFETYIDWLAVAYAVTLTGLPALSMPCGFTHDGLPVGLQLVGRPRGEAALLSAAGVLQDILDLPKTPINPREPSA